MCRILLPGYNSEDPSVRARVRGRSITQRLARLVAENDRGHYWVDMRSVLSGRQPLVATHSNAVATMGADRAGQPITDTYDRFSKQPDALKHVWARHIDPAGGWNEPIKHGGTETRRLYAAHAVGDPAHEGDNRVEGCPTCFPPTDRYPWNLSLARGRGWDESAHFTAILDEDEDAISLTHPTNWLSEEEVSERHGG